MRGFKSFGLILALVAVTACAPVVYDATYHTPVRHVATRVTYTQPVYRHEVVYRQAQSIEVTLFADNTYLGISFSPLHLTITDGQYVEIPVRDRRGRQARIYAHYHQNNLHFDSGRNCQGINGASRFSADSRWDKGQRYSNLNAGKDYDLTGLQLNIRKVPTESRRVGNNAAVKINNNSSQVRHYGDESSAKRPVVTIAEDHNRRAGAVNSDKRPTGRQNVTVAEKDTKTFRENNAKQLIKQKKTVEIRHEKVDRSAKRPAIVDKVIDVERSQRVAKGAEKSAAEKRAVNRMPGKRGTKDVAVPESQDSTDAQQKSSIAREETIAQNDRSDEESDEVFRSNRKAEAGERTSRGKQSR